MKTKFTKRMLSVFLALLMVLTSVPMSMFTAFADEIESIVWKYDAAQAGQNDSVASGTTLSDSKSISGKTASIKVNGSGAYNNAEKAITHVETGYIDGTINDVPADCNHWKFTFRFAYTGNQNDGSVPVFALGRSSSTVLVKVMSNGDYYISGSKIGTINNPEMLNCASVDDVRTATFEYNNGSLSFNIAGVEQFTCSNSTYVINATSHFVGGLKYFATGDSANQISGMNISKLIAASNADDNAKIETKSGTLNQNGYQILCNGTEGRWSNNQWNIVNDQEANNTSAGVVRIPLADVKNMTVNSATFKMSVDTASGDSECNGLDVYWSTDYSKVNGYIAGGQSNSVGCSSGAGTTANDSFATKLGFSRTGSLVATYPKSTTGEQSFDVKSVLQTIIDTNADYLFLVVMQKNAGGKGSGSGWSDTKVKPTSLSITYNVQNKVMAKSEVQAKLNAFSYSGITSQKGTWCLLNGNTTSIADSLESASQGKQNTYQNILWAGTSNFDNASCDRKSDKSMVSYLRFQPVVMLYDGKTSPRAPIMVVCGTSSKANRWILGMPMTDNDGNSLGLVHNWLGSRDSSYGQNWDYQNVYNRNGGTDMKVSQTYGTKSSENYRIGTSGWTGWQTTPGFSNIYQYNGTMINTTYLKTITPTVTAYVSGSDDNNWNDIVMPMTSNTPVYVVNYKSIIDKVASVKTDLNTFDPSLYTAASVQAYYDTIIALVSYDISSAGGKITSSDVAGGAQTIANELKALVDNYDTAKANLKQSFTVTFQYNNGKTLTKKVLSGNTCTVPDDDSPAEIEKFDADTHKVTRYYWGPADAKITQNVTYKEKTNISYESHAWVSTGETVAPTCEDDGYTVYECSVCGETSHQDLVDPTGHTYRPNQGSAVAPSNYTNGETYDSEKDYKHAIDCIISSSHTKKEESCNIGASWTGIDADTEKSTCSVCGGYVTRAIIHGYDIVFKDVNGNVIATNPTIEGEMPSTPNLLNYAYIDEDGHHSFSWNKEVVEATEATEYQMVENELVPHAYDDNYTQITAPTCYAEGLEADPCTVSRDCEYSKTRPIEKIAHTWGDWAYDEDQQKQYHTCTVEECKKTEYDECSFEVTENVAPTCTSQGHKKYTCTECGGSYTEYIMPLGHDDPATLPLSNYVAETCTTDGYSGDKICTKCGTTILEGRVVGALGHDYQVYTYKSTCVKDGYFTTTCSRGDTEAKEFPMTGFEYNEYDPSTTAYVNWSGSKSDGYEEKHKLNIGIEIDHFEISYTSKADWYAGAGTKTRWKLFDGKGNEIENRKVNNTTYSDTKTIEGSSFTIQAVDFRANEKVQVTSIKVYPKLPDGWTEADKTAKGHDTVIDARVEPTCLATGLTEGSHCSRCDDATVAQEIIPVLEHSYTGEAVHTDVDGDNNGYTEYHCVNGCNELGGRVYDTNDYTAYNSAVTESEEIAKNTVKYTADSIVTYQSEVEKAKIDTTDVTKSQAYINNATTAIISAQSVLELNSYTVKLYYVHDNVADEEPTVSVKNVYGTVVKFDIGEDYVAEKWIRHDKIDDKDKLVGTKNSTLEATITSNTDYYVHVKPAKASTEANTSTIFLKDKNGKVLSTAYVAKSEDAYDVRVDAENSTLTIAGQTIKAPSLAFYTFKEFRVDDVAVIDSMTVATETVDVVAIYEPTEVKYSITTDGSCTANVSSAYWDQKIVVKAADGNENTKWFVNGVEVAYGPTYSFRASANAHITCVNDSVAVPTATVLDLGYGSIREKTISAVCSFYVPEGYKVVETGALLKTSAVNNNDAVNNRDNYTGENDVTVNAKKFVATNIVKETNQFVINVSSSKTYTSLYMGAVAFVTVTDEDGNNEQTFYSPLVTTNYTA